MRTINRREMLALTAGAAVQLAARPAQAQTSANPYDLVAATDLCVFVLLALLLRGPFGHVGIGLAVTGSSAVQMLMLWLSLRKKLGIEKELFAVQNTRGKISKKTMIHNDATPDIEVDPETYEVRADGELLTCAPADVLPMAQRYFLF